MRHSPDIVRILALDRRLSWSTVYQDLQRRALLDLSGEIEAFSPCCGDIGNSSYAQAMLTPFDLDPSRTRSLPSYLPSTRSVGVINRHHPVVKGKIMIDYRSGKSSPIAPSLTHERLYRDLSASIRVSFSCEYISVPVVPSDVDHNVICVGSRGTSRSLLSR